MFKITKLSLEDYRSFHGGPYVVELNKGENLLLYGENGSGKSSIFKALQDWLRSGDQNWDPRSLEQRLNTFSGGEGGYGPRIEVEVSNLALEAEQQSKEGNPEGAVQTYHCSPAGTNSQDEVPFGIQMVRLVQSAEAAHGFLTYRQLLRTYFVEGADGKPNLFNLLVEQILRDQKPVGARSTIGEYWNSLQGLLVLPANSTDFTQLYGKERKDFNVHFGSLLKNQLQPLVNALLDRFFQHHIKLTFGFQGLDLRKSGNGFASERLSYEKNSKKIWAHRKVDVFVDYFGTDADRHHEFLNEARLNALAICIFLAGRIISPSHTQAPLKLLLLDDVFVGLDTSNRIPLLEMLMADKIQYQDGYGQEKISPLFRDYQVFIASYDRHWFNVARNWLHARDRKGWRYYELYVDQQGRNEAGKEFHGSILRPYEDELAAGIRYFRDPHFPDYTAAANYFRKAAEKLLQEWLPQGVVNAMKAKKSNKANAGVEPAHIMFKELLQKCKELFLQTGACPSVLEELDSYLKNILNPLSHFEREKYPIYRQELERMERILNVELPELLTAEFKFFLPKASKLRISIPLSDVKTHHYDLKLKDDLYRYRLQPNGPWALGEAPFQEKASRVVEENGRCSEPKKNTPPSKIVEEYLGLKDAWGQLREFNNLPVAGDDDNYLQACSCWDESADSYVPLQDKLNQA